MPVIILTDWHYRLKVPELSAESALAHFEFKVFYLKFFKFKNEFKVRKCFEFKNSASIYVVQIFIIKLF